MKVNLRTIIGILGGVVMVSCSTTTDEPDTSHTQIQFGAAVSRAAVNDEGGMSSFSVWGGYDGNNLFEKTKVTNQGKYEGGTRYWIPGKTFNFYAVHPHEGITSAVADDGTITITNFDCSKTGAEAVDLMTAKNTGITYTSGSLVLPVEMNFSHELAKLNFIVKSESDAVEVTQFKVFNVIYNGTLLGSSWNTFEKNTQGDNIYNSSSFILNINDGLSKNVFGDVLIIPHDNANLLNANVLISYKYSGEQEIKTQTLSLVVDNVIENWSSGQSYSYSLTIKPNGITFSGLKADEWSETSSGGNIPIE